MQKLPSREDHRSNGKSPSLKTKVAASQFCLSDEKFVEESKENAKKQNIQKLH